MTDSDQDLEMLNAYVDGELSPDARRLMEDRIATDPALARRVGSLTALKEGVRALGNDVEIVLIPTTKTRASPFMAIAAAVAVCVVFASGWLGALTFSHLQAPPAPSSEIAQALTIHDRWSAEVANSSFSSIGVAEFQAPELTKAGLTLVSLRADVRFAGMPAIQASYLGPHGCRLSLFRLKQAVSDQALRIVNDGNVQSAVWAHHSFRYIAVARKLNLTRFAILADAMQTMTTRSFSPAVPDMMATLESAHQPCTG